MKTQCFYESECFSLGDCEYPVHIEHVSSFTLDNELEVEIITCLIEVSGSDKNQVWARVDKEYFPVVELELLEALEQEASDNSGADEHDYYHKYGKDFK